MADPSVNTCDFLVMTHATIDLAQITAATKDLVADLDDGGLHESALYGRSGPGEIAVLYRFKFASYSVGLRRRMENVATHLKGRLLELNVLAEGERPRLEERLKAFDVQPPEGGTSAAAVATFREKMGLGTQTSTTPVLQLLFDDRDALLAAYARSITEGHLLIPTQRVFEKGAPLKLLLITPGVEPLETAGQVEEVLPRGVKASLEPTQALRDFVLKHTHGARAGRVVGPDLGARKHLRFESCLEVRFENLPQLRVEYGSNISRGGLFVQTYTPPPVRSQVTLLVTLPDGQKLTTEAEVVHVLGVEEALARGLRPGVGIAFRTDDPNFEGRIAALLEGFRDRPARVLLIDPDEQFRAILIDALGSEGFELEVASTAAEAMVKLTDGLFSIDLLLLELRLPDLPGAELIARIRKAGGELDLKVAVLSAGSPQELQPYRGRLGANEVFSKGQPLDDVVAGIKAMLGR